MRGSDLLYGAMLGGMSLGQTGSGFHHRLCHILGGKFNLVHADTHSVILPHVVAYNAPALPREMSRLADALGVPGGDPASALWDLARGSAVFRRTLRVLVSSVRGWTRWLSRYLLKRRTIRCPWMGRVCGRCSMRRSTG